MSEDRLELAMTGELAAAVRAAAEASGVSPATWVVQTIAPALGMAGGAGPAGGPANTPGGSPPAGSTAAQPGPGAWETVQDPSGAFVLAVPRGWQRELKVLQVGYGEAQVATVSSPDHSTTISISDPEIPLFLVPAMAMAPLPGAVPRPQTPAEQFGPEYLQYHYGNRPGFRLVGVSPAPQLVELNQRKAQRDNIPLAWSTGAECIVEYTEGDQRVQVVALVTTGGMNHVWFAGVSRIISTSDARAHLPTLLQMLTTLDHTPQARQRINAKRAMQDAQHQATMQNIQMNTQMMTQQHNQRMADIRSSGIAHQQRMAGLQATWDAQNASWHQQQATNDASHSSYMSGLRQESTYGGYGGTGGGQHQDFLNMIKEERTVVDATGHEHQVEAGYDKYYYREYDDSWIGLQQHQDIHDVPGINPDDYQETRLQS